MAHRIKYVINNIAELCGLRSEVRDIFATMELHAVPDAMCFPTLRAIHVKVGDVLFLPGGCLLAEKSINEVSLAFKVNALFMDEKACHGFRIAMKQAR